MNNRAFSKIWIIVIILVLVGGGVLTWQYLRLSKEKSELPKEVEVSQEEVIGRETADWKIYRNILQGYEIKYPKDFYLFTERVYMVGISSEPDPLTQDIGPHEKVIIDIYRFPNYKNRSLDYLCSHHIDFKEGQKIQIGKNLAVRSVKEEFPGIFTYFVRDDGYIYVLRGASGTTNYFNQYRELIEKIENTFKFIEKEEVLAPTGVEPSKNSGWWIYKNTKYKYTIEFPDEIDIEDFENIFTGRLSESSRTVNFYLEKHPAIPNLTIKVPFTYDPEKKPFSREELINQFISIDPKYDSIDATNIFNQMLSTFKLLE